MEENLDEFDYMIINVESCLNGSMLLFTIGVIRDESIEKAITLFHSQHKGYSIEMSFLMAV